MLGRTAGGLFWLFRYLERTENSARLIEAGQRIALTRSSNAESEWASVLQTSGARTGYDQKYADYDAATVVDYMLRDKDNPSSVMASIAVARDNARMVRTALTREVWEAVNECYLTMRELLARRVAERDLPSVLGAIRQRSANVRGALHGTMMRNDIYDFCRIGTFLERADNTARLLDVKYYVLLPSAMHVGSSIDNVQWETILRSVSAEGAFRMVYDGEMQPLDIANFLIFDRRFPRSLAFCFAKISENLGYLEGQYATVSPVRARAAQISAEIDGNSIDHVFDSGLHEAIGGFLEHNTALGLQIENEFRFNG